MAVDVVGTVTEELEVIATERAVGDEADGVDHKVGRIGAALGLDGGHAPALTMVGHDALAEVALDTVLGEVLVHGGGELGVVVARERGGGDVEEADLLAAALRGLGDLDADVARADDGDGAHVIAAHPVVDLLALLEELEEADAVELAAGKLGRDRQGAGRQDQLVVGLVEGGAVCALAVDHVALEVDRGHGGLEVDVGALRLERLLVGVEELVAGIDLATDPQRRTATQVAEVGVAIDHDDLLIGIVVEQGVRGGDARMVGSDDDGLHWCESFQDACSLRARAHGSGSARPHPRSKP